MEIKAPKGTQDILPDEIHKWHAVEKAARDTAELFGYREIRTPIFESTDLFARGIGEGTDIVEKEMYTFLDKGERSLTLRPEITASVMRALLEHKKTGGDLLKLYYIGPIFRYERPQKGRFRQSHQFGVEAIGSDSPQLDAEQICLAMEFYKRLGLDKLSVDINSIGCSNDNCRPAYRRDLITYLKENTDTLLGVLFGEIDNIGNKGLCDDCARRMVNNPLRVFDCKKDGCKQIISRAPRTYEHLCDDCRAHFEKVKETLELLGVKYRVNPNIVRGLDYYTRTVYEVLSESLGAQNALCGGGRYDNLAGELGGVKVGGTGFAAGIERAIMVMDEIGKKPERPGIPVIILPVGGEKAMNQAVTILKKIRDSGIPAELDYNNRGFKLLKKSEEEGWRFAFIIGEDELKEGKVSIKHLIKRDQKGIETAELEELLDSGGKDPVGILENLFL
ncbi:MAG: histidine--tRNA ligase [Chloroflexi bacterium]|nr:histidine--tRNA ligase [Chloroflexota bacterium]